MPVALLIGFVAMAAGVAVGRAFPAFGARLAGALQRAVLFVCLPALVLRQASQLPIGSGVEFLVPVLAPWLIGSLAALAAARLAAWLRLPPPVRTCLIVLTMLGNTAYLGYPLVAATLGEPALPYAVLYDQLGSFLILSLVAPAWIGADGDAPLGWRNWLLALLAFPGFVAFLVAILLPVPEALREWLRWPAEALPPLALLSVGLALRFRLPPGQGRALWLGLSLKMPFSALLALALVRLTGLPEPAASTVVLQAAMPPMVTAALLLARAGKAPELAQAMVGHGVLLGAAAWLLVEVVP